MRGGGAGAGNWDGGVGRARLRSRRRGFGLIRNPGQHLAVTLLLAILTPLPAKALTLYPRPEGTRPMRGDGPHPLPLSPGQFKFCHAFTDCSRAACEETRPRPVAPRQNRPVGRGWWAVNGLPKPPATAQHETVRERAPYPLSRCAGEGSLAAWREGDVRINRIW